MLRARFMAVLAIVVGGCAAISVLAARPGGGGPTAIAFVSIHQKTFSREICGTSAAGGSQVTLVKGVGGLPRWSPDGTRLLFVEGAVRDEAIVSVAANGADRRVLLTFPEVDAFNALDGRPSALLSAPFGWRGIFTADWSPDGTSVAFDALTGYRDSSGGLYFRHRVYVVRLSDGQITRVTDDPDPLFSEDGVDWSESLNVIGFARLPWGGEGGNEIWGASPGGAWSRPLLTTESTGLSLPYYFDWSHGGDPLAGTSRIAFSSHGVLFIAAIDLLAENPGTIVDAIQSPGFSLDYQAWSPDDTTLAFTRSDGSRSQLATYDLASGAQRVLIQEDESRRKLFAPDWRRVPE